MDAGGPYHRAEWNETRFHKKRSEIVFWPFVRAIVSLAWLVRPETADWMVWL